MVGGYAILQPRVTPSLPVGREGSFYQKLFSAPGGIDPYSAAASDVYQDLFGEGSYTGKGIYDVDAFEAALAGRVPPNTMLSHDLFEGIFARAGLASDVEVIEEFPSRYDVAAKRQHRWTRGDWQLLPWVFGHKQAGAAVPAIGLGKMLDNLRRSLLAPLTLATLVLCWLLPLPAAAQAVALVLAALAIPAFLAPLFAIVPRRANIQLAKHLRMLAGDLRLAVLQVFFSLAFLPDQAWRMADAIARDPGAAGDAPPPAGVDHGRPVGAGPAPGSARLLPPDGRRHRARCRHGGRRAVLRPGVVAAGPALRAAVAGRAGAGLVGQPFARGRAARAAVAGPRPTSCG